ncbi:Type II/IV secretion system protein TadC associated with Flp pilus assembly [Paramagnetospirillum magnetotacticum MS-1]|uniref:Type II/IV secretion system protein TadC associated with Flp pilus assembly n=1 Tax=Paramagnetospirillum magnetotacticum MS-1 TaxID=272627 RepID=A0A0C2V3S0_PARME|nr:type II secretion system F family protein [Paramagnetospirillum magnetotacticum]KIL99711.1 Type II/IV secretion system protein TadC associated with Flp pilus assembly [Paramagnetospirillum magnetotacticum MS-1]
MLTTLIVITAALAAAASVLALALPLLARDRRAARIKAVSGRRRELSERQKADLDQARGSGRRRGAMPQRRVALMRAVIDRLKLQDLMEAKALKAKLAQAGWRGQAAPLTFIFARVALPVLLLALGLIYATTLFDEQPLMIRAMILAVAMGAGGLLPNIWLANAVQKRQLALGRAFPDALDLIVICVDAGLSVETALGRVTEEMMNSSPEMAEEIGLTAAELAFLADRRQAWENFAGRTGLPQVKSLSTALIQSEKYGTPVAQALKVLSQENRESRMAAAEKKAAALPAKLTVPMIVFFLPVLFLMIAGPAALQVSGMLK